MKRTSVRNSNQLMTAIPRPQVTCFSAKVSTSTAPLPGVVIVSDCNCVFISSHFHYRAIGSL
jgi:hypothetical protein